MVLGTKSQFNGNDDGILRVMPENIIPFASMRQVLRGLLRIRVSANQVNKGFLREIAAWIPEHPGHVTMQIEIQTNDADVHLIQTEHSIYPENQVLNWLEKNNLEFTLEVNPHEEDS